jgi:hypothetical protein
MPTYADGTQAKVGDVVIEIGHPERYIVLGFEDGHSAKLLLIGTVIKEDSPLFGKTIILPTGYRRSVPLGVLQRLGYAEITIGKDSASDDAVDTE